MEPTIALINPFPNDVRSAFKSYIESPAYTNRERIEYTKWRELHILLDNPDRKPRNQTESRLKHRALSEFELINNRLHRRPDSKHPEPRYVVPENEAFDTIANQHLRLLHAGKNKTWEAVQQKFYGITRAAVEFVIKRCKNCALNRPAATKAPLVPIVTSRAWERVQADLIDMRHEPSGQYKWILHIKDHFSKYTQLYPLKSKHAEPIAEEFTRFIAAFLPPKIVQTDNGKEFKGALLVLLRKYGIQIINGAPRSPQTQGLVEQANGVVEAKLRAWKMDNGSTEWANGIMEVTLAMNTQKHSTIGCAPVELLFRERTSYIDWLNQQKRVDPTIGVAQEDSTEPPIYTLSPSTPTPSPAINIGVGPGSSQITMHISPEAALGSEINVRISSPTQSCSNYESEKEQTGPQNTDQVIAKAQKATQKAKLRMMQKYSKQHTIQHFNIGDIVSVKVPREDRTSTDNRRLFGRILVEPYAHRYKVLTTSGVIKRLIPTKGLSAVNESLWPDISIPRSTKEVTLTEAARDASTSARVGVSCQCKGECKTKRCRCYKEDKKCTVHCHRDDHNCGNQSELATGTELALVERPKRKRARADTVGNSN
ncbi:SCAN domain-containing protein 3 [Metarhizium anisopliae]|nr:SCAN domain-containing protein 3 [Metarhizium anisopliae]